MLLLETWQKTLQGQGYFFMPNRIYRHELLVLGKT
jgi:hypothetical protein